MLKVVHQCRQFAKKQRAKRAKKLYRTRKLCPPRCHSDAQRYSSQLCICLSKIDPAYAKTSCISVGSRLAFLMAMPRMALAVNS